MSCLQAGWGVGMLRLGGGGGGRLWEEGLRERLRGLPDDLAWMDRAAGGGGAAFAAGGAVGSRGGGWGPLGEGARSGADPAAAVGAADRVEAPRRLGVGDAAG